MLGTLFLLGQIALAVLIFAVAMDFFLLYRTKGIRSFRQCSSRFSNGDDNEVHLRVESSYAFPVRLSMRGLLYSSSVISVLICLSEAVKGKRLPIICIPPGGGRMVSDTSVCLLLRVSD